MLVLRWSLPWYASISQNWIQFWCWRLPLHSISLDQRVFGSIVHHLNLFNSCQAGWYCVGNFSILLKNRSRRAAFSRTRFLWTPTITGNRVLPVTFAVGKIGYWCCDYFTRKPGENSGGFFSNNSWHYWLEYTFFLIEPVNRVLVRILSFDLFRELEWFFTFSSIFVRLVYTLPIRCRPYLRVPWLLMPQI